MNPIIRSVFSCLRNTSRSLLNYYDRAQTIDPSKLQARLLEQLLHELHERHPEIVWDHDGENLPKNDLGWIVPIDALNNFVRKIPIMTMQASCSRWNFHTQQHELSWSVIYDPLHDHVLYAQRGQGAFMDQRRIRLSKKASENPVIILENAPKWANRLPQNVSIRSLGSLGSAHAMTACGQVEACLVEEAHPSELAAGSLLIEEAGGVILDTQGQAMRWNDPGTRLIAQAHFAGSLLRDCFNHSD